MYLSKKYYRVKVKSVEIQIFLKKFKQNKQTIRSTNYSA